MTQTTETAEDSTPRSPRPMGLLSYALANLIQSSGDAIQFKTHHPPESKKTLEAELATPPMYTTPNEHDPHLI